MFEFSQFGENKKLPLLLGIVNATGDSFSEGVRSSPDLALERALQLLDEGADIIDLGGESTRPGALTVSPMLEQDRIIPVLENLLRLRPQTVVSIDTKNSSTAAVALAIGAKIINDVSMLRNDPEMVTVVSKYKSGLILTHSRGTSKDMQTKGFCSYPEGVTKEVVAELLKVKKIAIKAGVLGTQILLDPGIGFAKTSIQCWELVKDLVRRDDLKNWVFGISRKSFLGELVCEPIPDRRSGATLALELFLAYNGVGALRTHCVRELHQALLVKHKLMECNIL